MSIAVLSGAAVNTIWDHSAAQTLVSGQNVVCIDESILMRANCACTNDSTATATFTNCIIRCQAIDYVLSWGSQATISTTVTLDRCQLHYNIAGVRMNMRISKILGTTIRCTSTGGLVYLYTQGGNKAEINSVDGRYTVFDNIYVHEIVGVPLIYKNCIYKNCGINILNWIAGVLPLRGVTLNPGVTAGTGGETWDAWVGNVNTNFLLLYSCTIRMTQIAINRPCVANDKVVYRFWARADIYTLNGTGLLDAVIVYTPSVILTTYSQIATYGVNATGYLTLASVETKLIDLLASYTNDSGTTRGSGLADPATIRNYTVPTVAWTRIVRRADIVSLETTTTPVGDVGAIDGAIQGDGNSVFLVGDENFTGTIAQAAALTGIAFSYNSGTGKVTCTITAARSGQEIYNRWKYWSSLAAQITPTLVPQNKVTKINYLTVVGTVTIGGGGSISDPYTDDTGTRLPITITCKNSYGIAINGMRIRIEKVSDKSLITEGTTNASGIFSIINYLYTADVNVKVVARLKGYINNSALGTITNVGLSIPFTMIKDFSINLP